MLLQYRMPSYSLFTDAYLLTLLWSFACQQQLHR